MMLMLNESVMFQMCKYNFNWCRRTCNAESIVIRVEHQETELEKALSPSIAMFGYVEHVWETRSAGMFNFTYGMRPDLCVLHKLVGLL